jgi:hypothetical protein
VNPELVLYRRENCSLCDYAVQALVAAGQTTFRSVDVGWQGALAERYGWRIPVLHDARGARELDWPFDAWSVRRFIAEDDGGA